MAVGREVVTFDIGGNDRGVKADILDGAAVGDALDGCPGVVHLGAVSRVLWGEWDPVRCREVNVEGTRNVLAAAQKSRRAPWVLVASSREVYGNAINFPVPESAPFRPLNAYARSKVDVEKMVRLSSEAGLRASVVRFSSVYGVTADHADRVAPGFARRAAAGGTLHVEGTDTTLDGHGSLPVLHLVSGRATTLSALADIAVKAAGRGRVEITPARTYDVSKFVGDPGRAEKVLGWRATTTIEEGISRLVASFSAELGSGVREPLPSSHEPT